MAAQAWLANRQLGGWLAPGAFFSLVWTALVVLCLILAPEYKIWPGVLWILFMTVTAHLGALLARPGGADLVESPYPVRPAPSFPLLMPLLFLASGLAIAGVLYLISTIGEVAASLFSLRDIGRIAYFFAGSRYIKLNEYGEPPGFVALMSFAFLAGYLAGLAFAQTRSKIRRTIAALALIPALMITLTLGARTTVAAVGIGAIATYCALRAYMGDRQPWTSSSRALIMVALTVVLFTGFYVAVQLVRVDAFDPRFSLVSGSSQKEVTQISLSDAKNHYVGCVPLFSQWFSDYWDVWDTPGFGYWSFDGPVGWLGYKIKRSLESVQVSPDPDAPRTNIFSPFCYMALDWTLPGSAVVLLIMSFAASIADRKVRAGNVACLPFTAFFYQFALYPMTPITRYTVVDGAWLMLVIYVWLTRLPAVMAQMEFQNPSH